VERGNEKKGGSMKKYLPVTKSHGILKGGYYYKGDDIHVSIITCSEKSEKGANSGDILLISGMQYQKTASKYFRQQRNTNILKERQ